MPVAPKNHALVVIDMLQDYFDVALWPDSVLPQQRTELVAHITQLVDSCRRHSVPIIWVRQAFQPDLSDAFPHMRKNKRSYTIAGTPGCEILPELRIQKGDTVLFKKRFSAFFHTDLDTILHRMQINALILAGITTSWCVRATAVDGYQRDFGILLAKDCLAGFTREDHQTSLRAMDGYIATAANNAELHDMLSALRKHSHN